MFETVFWCLLFGFGFSALFESCRSLNYESFGIDFIIFKKYLITFRVRFLGSVKKTIGETLLCLRLFLCVFCLYLVFPLRLKVVDH